MTAAALRVAAQVAYAPALFWSDSWGYLGAARGHLLYPEKPSGYPLVLRILGLATKDLSFVTLLQHLAGLAGGALVYALLRRVGLRKLVAATVAGIVLLDSYAIALEQHVLSEAFFTFGCVVWVYAAVGRDRRPATIALAGFALAAATTMRTVALFAVPVWVLYSLWTYRDARRRMIAVTAALAPLICYAALHQIAVGGFALAGSEGRSLYGRIAEIGNCRGLDLPGDLRALCPARRSVSPDAQVDPVDFFDFSPGSPARAILARPGADARLRRFALHVIAARPLTFAQLIAADTVKLFEPGEMSPLPVYDQPIEFPAKPRPIRPVFEPQHALYAPGYVPLARSPARELVDYQRWVHTPRWLVGPMVVVGLLEVLIAVVWRQPLPHRREVLLLTGSGLSLLVGGTINHFEPRYLIPAIPLLLAGGSIATHDLVGWVRSRSTRSGRPPLPARRT